MAARIKDFYIPHDLMIIILKRLPVKSLWRFRSVCKQWNDTITSLDFKRKHFHHTSKKDRLLIHWCGFREQPPQAVWNISTRKLRPLPSPQEFITNDEFGFGVDPLTGEFKIVLIHDSSHFSVYKSSNNCWKYCDSEPLLKDCFVTSTQCGTTFSQGFFYWRESDNMTSTSAILAFDMCNETFREIELPSEIRDEVFLEYLSDENGVGIIAGPPGLPSNRQALLDLFEGSLALTCFDFDIDLCEGNCVDVWLMKEQGCWTKLFSLELNFYFHRPLGFWMGKSIIFSSKSKARNEELLMHDPSSRKTRKVRFPAGEDVSSRMLFVFNYEESLFP